MFRNGDVFEGIYSNGNRDGYGKEVKINGDIYEGTWKGSEKITGTLRRTKHGCEIKFEDGKTVDNANNLYCLNFTWSCEMNFILVESMPVIYAFR